MYNSSLQIFKPAQNPAGNFVKQNNDIMETNTQQQRIVLVTGGSRGIGKSIALNAAKRGLGVILTYNSNKEQGEAVAQTIEDAGGKAIAMKLDTGTVDTFDKFAVELKRNLNSKWNTDQLEYLVNNAGIAQRSLIRDTTEAQFDELVNVNFKGMFFLTQKLLPLVTDYGHVINISSALARVSFPGTAVYGALKAALDAVTRYFAKEFAERKIRFNSVAPGAIDTEFGGGKGDEAHRQQVASAIALGRLGEADDLGSFIASLLSDDSRYLNAQRIEVSGGIMI
jgi:NAD(P)-dependent dehydrogenase (short-subunit alcohol dehydrogenase family)